MITFREIKEQIEEIEEEELLEAPQDQQQQIDPMMMLQKGAEFFMRVRAASTAAHIAHLQTSSYAAHVALGDFYSDIIPLIDTFMENLQGRFGKAQTYPNISEKSPDPLTIIGNLTKWVDTNRAIFQSSEFQNIIDEILMLLNSTAYKIRELK